MTNPSHSPARGRVHRRVTRAIVVAVAVLMSLIGFPATALAAPTIAVEVGFQGRHRPGTDLLVQVEVDADRLIDGELIVSSANDGSSTNVVIPVELAGGARKRFVAVLPSILQWQGRISVQLVEGGTVLASEQVNIVADFEDELVGVLPSLTQNMPAAEPLAVPLGNARFFAVDDALLSFGPGTIDALGTLIASAVDLTQLSPAAQTSVLAWVQSGGTLVLDEAPGPVPGFGVTASDSSTPVGSGRVMASGGAFSQGQWTARVLPTPFAQDPGNSGLTGELTGEVAWFGGPLANSLAADAGFGLPSLRLVLPLMGAYVLIIGPLAWFTLRRMGRSRLLWVALPTLALVFTAMVWIGGTALRSSANDAHGTVIQIEEGVARGRSTILRSSRNGSTAGITLPAPWRAVQTQDFQWGFTSTDTVLRPSLDSTRVESSLDAGEFVLFGGTGPLPEFDDALVVSAKSAVTGETTGTVTNQLDFALEEVAVFTGFQGVNIGTIQPGETVDFTVDGVDLDPRFGEPAELRVWRNAIDDRFGGNVRFGGNADLGETSAVNIELWGNFINSNVGRVRQQGVVTVVGWTSELSSPIDDAVTAGRTAIMARQTIAPVSNELSDVASRRQLLRGAEQAAFQENVNGFVVSSTWRLDVPDGIDTGTLALQLPGTIESIELWDGTNWLRIDDINPGSYALPPGAFVDGSIYVKPAVNFDRQAALGRDFSLTTVDDPAELSRDLVNPGPTQ